MLQLFTAVAALVNAALVVNAIGLDPATAEIPAIDCATVLCLDLLPDCEPGQIAKVPEGQCCSICVTDCSLIADCANPLCQEGEELVTPEGQCCPQCVPSTPDNCSLIGCAKPLCQEGEELVTPEGECCPECVPSTPDCSAVSCLLPVCEAGEKLITPEGECCPECVPSTPDCSAVSCLLPVCEAGEKLVTPEGECCPECVPSSGPDCSAVLCLVPICQTGQTLVVPEGECCPKCVPDCSTILCAKPLCQEGEELVTPEGECCPVCQPVCEINGQIFSTCASACPATCDDTGPKICPAVCIVGCTCPPGQVIDNMNNECVTPDECPDVDPCTLVDCKPNSVCKVDPGTGTAFCEPSCDLDNGGCRDDQLCKLNHIKCVTTPCLPEIECVDLEEVCSQEPEVGPCRARLVRYFYNNTSGQCETFEYGGCRGNDNQFETLEECNQTCNNPCIGFECPQGSACKVFEEGEGDPEAFCEPSCELDNGGCQSNEVCELQTVQCVRAPCPPVVTCRNPCATVRCANGYECEVFEPTGEAFCQPNCSLNNGGCPADQECQLRQVQCVRAPCPPVIECMADCPPTCTEEFCSKKENRKGMCSNLNGPREIPGCAGPCQLTYCRTCYFDDEHRSPPEVCSSEQCENLQDYLTDSRCFRRWGVCVRRNQVFRSKGVQKTEENYRCHNPQCPLRG